MGLEAAASQADSIITSYRDHCHLLGRGGSVYSCVAGLSSLSAHSSPASLTCNRPYGPPVWSDLCVLQQGLRRAVSGPAAGSQPAPPLPSPPPAACHRLLASPACLPFVILSLCCSAVFCWSYTNWLCPACQVLLYKTCRYCIWELMGDCTYAVQLDSVSGSSQPCDAGSLLSSRMSCIILPLPAINLSVNGRVDSAPELAAILLDHFDVSEVCWHVSCLKA